MSADGLDEAGATEGGLGSSEYPDDTSSFDPVERERLPVIAAETGEPVLVDTDADGEPDAVTYEEGAPSEAGETHQTSARPATSDDTAAEVEDPRPAAGRPWAGAPVREAGAEAGRPRQVRTAQELGRAEEAREPAMRPAGDGERELGEQSYAHRAESGEGPRNSADAQGEGPGLEERGAGRADGGWESAGARLRNPNVSLAKPDSNSRNNPRQPDDGDLSVQVRAGDTRINVQLGDEGRVNVKAGNTRVTVRTGDADDCCPPQHRPNRNPGQDGPQKPSGSGGGAAQDNRTRLDAGDPQADRHLTQAQREHRTDLYERRMLTMSDEDLEAAMKRNQRLLKDAKDGPASGQRFSDIAKLRMGLLEEEMDRRERYSREPYKGHADKAREMTGTEIKDRIATLQNKTKEACCTEDLKKFQQELTMMRRALDTRDAKREFADKEPPPYAQGRKLSEEKLGAYKQELRGRNAKELDVMQARLERALDDAEHGGVRDPDLAAQSKQKLAALRKERDRRDAHECCDDKGYAKQVQALSTGGLMRNVDSIEEALRELRGRVGLEEQVRELEQKSKLLKLELDTRPDLNSHRDDRTGRRGRQEPQGEPDRSGDTHHGQRRQQPRARA